MPDALVVVRNGPALADPRSSWGGAFADGLRRHGWKVRVASQPATCDLLVMWGVRRSDWTRRQKASGGEVCILERGYLPDRFEYASVSFGGRLNGRAEFRGPFHDGSRWEKHFAHHMQPWRVRDGYALVLGQVPGDMSISGADIHGFYQRAERAFKALGYQTRFRPHPNKRPAKPLADDLAGAAVAVTYNSNSGVDAVLAGVPTVAMDEGSMAWAVAGHELAVPPTPDRVGWAYRLAWCQWRKEEMASGECWAAIGAT